MEKETKWKDEQTRTTENNESRREFVKKNLARALFVTGAAAFLAGPLSQRPVYAKGHGDVPAYSDMVHNDWAHSDSCVWGVHGDLPHGDGTFHQNTSWHDWWDAPKTGQEGKATKAYHVDAA